jgi:hypothetical protein
MWSSPSARPYEQASTIVEKIHQYMCGLVGYDELNVPAPNPFSPFSNSSRSRKFRGTLAAIVYERYISEQKEERDNVEVRVRGREEGQWLPLSEPPITCDTGLIGALALGDATPGVVDCCIFGPCSTNLTRRKFAVSEDL